MRIGVNTRLLIEDKLEGIGYFSLKTLERISRNHPETEFIFFFDRPFSKKFVFSPNVKAVVIPLPTRHPMLWHIYFDFLLPFYLKMYRIDLFLSPDGYIPTWGRTKTLPVIHDINYEHDSTFLGKKSYLRYYKHFFPKFARKATRVATVSEFSKADISNIYKIPQDKIDVVYSAANEQYRPHTEEENIQTKAKYTDGKDFFYFVGALHKRKNLVNLFRAFDLFKNQSRSDVKLVIVGNKKWWEGEIAEAYEQMRFRDEVVFTSRLPLEEVNRIASASIACVFVSLFEGFGLPPLEAFRSHTAAIISDTTSLPEIGADAAIYASPTDVESIAKAMNETYTQPEKREECIRKGIVQAEKFSWDKTAELLWNTITKALEQ
ncbi:MAG: glycosyltransferase family 4 protein [Bacteroidales bacterium]|nr:glycosyltransferase family 4 protein [Bacteroidales bacterium]MEE0926387.1 glycosyltransferase family 1 protein [Bacteroidales bacterium]